MVDFFYLLTWLSSLACAFLLGYMVGQRRRDPPNGNGNGEERQRGIRAAL